MTVLTGFTMQSFETFIHNNRNHHERRHGISSPPAEECVQRKPHERDRRKTRLCLLSLFCWYLGSTPLSGPQLIALRVPAMAFSLSAARRTFAVFAAVAAHRLRGAFARRVCALFRRPCDLHPLSPFHSLYLCSS